ncbi:hypothetical protein HanHA300_Chr06g0226581 [Helianthus annuus]|nr:hypothetical protein HanHA300_Chr06g0226581 [Helianthus annuus]KAJ0574820.1 hypothetical protein HanHA89_Chr06g0242531 [Helianthus annuus]KAJ0739151.1 hypothetical protein HanLR1_Chr06g0226441 [Helianthus annuus]
MPPLAFTVTRKASKNIHMNEFGAGFCVIFRANMNEFGAGFCVIFRARVLQGEFHIEIKMAAESYYYLYLSIKHHSS